MNNEKTELEKQNRDLSRGVLINRYLLIFIALCVGTMLFLPRLALIIAAYSNEILDLLAPRLGEIIGGIVGLIVIFAVVASIRAKVSTSSECSPTGTDY